MKQITFGLPQLKTEVPAIIKLVYRSLGFASAMAAFIFTQVQISASLQAHILTALVIGNYALYSFCQFFGYAPPGDGDNTGSSQPTSKTTVKGADTISNETNTQYS